MSDPIYQKILELLESGKKIILAKTIRRTGSTPRDIGSMCIFTEDDELIGTIGGGLLEYKARKKAMTLLESGESYIYEFKLSNDDLAKNGMICGGDVDLFLEPLFPENRNTVNFFRTLNSSLAQSEPMTLVTRIENGSCAGSDKARMLISGTDVLFGRIDDFNTEWIDQTDSFPFTLIEPENQGPAFFIEKLVQQPRVYLFGAGHVSVFVAKLAAFTGFDVTVIDDRKDFANPLRFPDADEIQVLDFKEAFSKLDIRENAYILIITRGHLHDKIVLEMALETPAAYIGMIGSVKKRNTIYRDLMSNGVTKERLDAVYSPIGIDINAETPEEIAVSIVAELIQKRAPKKEKRQLIL